MMPVFIFFLKSGQNGWTLRQGSMIAAGRRASVFRLIFDTPIRHVSDLLKDTKWLFLYVSDLGNLADSLLISKALIETGVHLFARAAVAVERLILNG
jgi:hypothetical protein